MTTGFAIDPVDGTLIIPDMHRFKISRLNANTGVLSAIAGCGIRGNFNGLATTARFWYPIACTCDSYGNIYVCDSYSLKIIGKDVDSYKTKRDFANKLTNNSYSFLLTRIIIGSKLFVLCPELLTIRAPKLLEDLFE